MDDMKKNIRRVFWLYFFLFLITVLYLGKFILVDSRTIVNSTYNPRLSKEDDEIMRGQILDQYGNILAESVLGGTGYERVYPYGDQFAHITGFNTRPKAGVESKYNIDLQQLDMEIVQRVNNLASGSPLTGNAISLTVDANLQKIAYDELGNNKGGVVVMEPSTGKILAMVSYPAYNPSAVPEKWEELRTDEENSPLLNRAAQGLYPPGSVYKIVMAAAVIEHIENWEEYSHHCVGHVIIGDKRIRCFNETAHGDVNLGEAIKNSCNTYFAAVGVQMGPEAILDISEKAYFNQSYNFDLERVLSRFTWSESPTESELMETAIGQGKTLVTPLHMAMITSAIANGGKMMTPYIADHMVTKNGGTKNKVLPQMLTQAFTLEQSAFITDMMVSVVDGGTATNASISGIKVAGKTGTAENASGDDHGWFVAFAPADNPEIAIAIVTENSGGSKKPISIAHKLLSAYFNQ